MGGTFSSKIVLPSPVPTAVTKDRYYLKTTEKHMCTKHWFKRPSFHKHNKLLYKDVCGEDGEVRWTQELCCF